MTKRILVFALGLFVSCGVAMAQTLSNLPPAGASQLAKFFPAYGVGSATAGQQNLNTLVGGYITPIAEDFGSLIGGGWYTTAKTHARFGFDLYVSINAISAGSDSKYFPINGLNNITYNGTTPTSGGNGQAPTAYGPESEFPSFTFNSGPNFPGVFVGPSGGNISKDVPIGSVAVPTLTGGIGLFANTDLRFRFTPETTINSTSLGNWGFGILHDIKQHIPGIKMAPIQLSLFLGYAQMTAKTNMGGIYDNASTGGSSAGQEGIGDTKNYTVQALISWSVPVLTFYGGIGYNSSTTDYKINGSYYVNKAFIAYDQYVPLPSPFTVTNPFSQSFSSSGVRFSGGMRFKFGPVFLNGDYTFYNSKGLYTVGFGFTVR